MMSYRLVAVLVLLLGGSALLSVQTEREFINLQPTEGRANTQVLVSDGTYKQIFQVNRTSLARVGVHLRSLSRNLPDQPVTITVWRGKMLIARQEVSPQFIDNEGATQILLKPAPATQPGERLAVEVSVDKNLSGQIGWQLRRQDGSFDPWAAQLLINGQPQPDPGAYQAWHHSRPALAVQMGGLLILAALLLAVRSYWQVRPSWLIVIYAVAASLLYAAPAFLIKDYPVWLVAGAVAGLLGMYRLMRQTGAAILPALFAANIFSFTTWFALHLSAGRSVYILAAVLPLLMLVKLHRSSLVNGLGRIFLVFGLLGILLLIGKAVGNWTDPAVLTANWRDVWLDPNQAPTANPIGTYSLTWHHFGSYIGLPALALSILGIAARGWRFKTVLIVGWLGALLALQPAIATAVSSLPLMPAHFVIAATLALAFFAGWGLQTLQNFWGRTDRLVITMTSIIVILSLLDVWHVAATVLEFPIGS